MGSESITARDGHRRGKTKREDGKEITALQLILSTEESKTFSPLHPATAAHQYEGGYQVFVKFQVSTIQQYRATLHGQGMHSGHTATCKHGMSSLGRVATQQPSPPLRSFFTQHRHNPMSDLIRTCSVFPLMADREPTQMGSLPWQPSTLAKFGNFGHNNTRSHLPLTCSAGCWELEHTNSQTHTPTPVPAEMPQDITGNVL